MAQEANFLRIYRRYTDAELAAEIATLKTQLQDPYISVGSGGSTAQKDIDFIAKKLDGALQAQFERTNGKRGTRTTLASFGGSRRNWSGRYF